MKVHSVLFVGFILAAAAGKRRSTDIRAMKTLLQSLFNNYSEEMQKLNSKLLDSSEKFRHLERKMNRRCL